MVAICQLEQLYDFWEIQMKPVKNTHMYLELMLCQVYTNFKRLMKKIIITVSKLFVSGSN